MNNYVKKRHGFYRFLTAFKGFFRNNLDAIKRVLFKAVAK